MIWLGLRLGLAGDRRVITMSAISAIAVAVGTTLLLLALSVLPALQARSDRTAWIDTPFGPYASYGATPASQDGTVPSTTITTSSDSYHSAFISVIGLSGSGQDAPVPPGLSALPAVGEVLASPALRDLMRSAPELVSRYGKVVGTVGPSGIAGPDALVAVRGISDTDASLTGLPVVGFPAKGELLQFTGVIRLLILLGGVAMLAPIALFVAMATRLAATSRDRRFAALRLAGATSGQVARLAAAESFVAGSCGVLLGIGLFILVRPLGAYVSYDGIRWFPSDLNPGFWRLALVVVGVSLVVSSATWTTIGRVARSPFGVSRRTGRRQVSGWRLLPLAAAIPILAFVLHSDQAASATGGRGRLVTLAFASLLGSLVFAGPWFISRIGRSLARSSGAAGLLAGRRLADDPRGGFRAIGGVVLAILVTTMFVVTTPAAARSLQSTKSIGQREGSAQAAIFASSGDESAALLDAVRAVEGIPAATLVYEGQADALNDSVQVWIGDCSEITRAQQLDRVPCGAADVVVAENTLFAPPLDAGTLTIRGLPPFQPRPPRETPGTDEVSSVTLHQPPTATMPALTGFDLPQIVVSPNAAGPVLSKLRPTLLVLRYESQEALEQVRNLVLQSVPNAYVSTSQTSYDGYSSDVRRLYRVVTAANLGVFFVAGFSLVVAIAIGLLERRRPFALLRAAGTSIQTLQRTILLEAAVPLIFMSALSLILGALVGTWTTEVDRGLIPWAQLGVPIAAGVVSSLMVVVFALPMVRRATSSEETRFE